MGHRWRVALILRGILFWRGTGGPSPLGYDAVNETGATCPTLNLVRRDHQDRGHPPWVTYLIKRRTGAVTTLYLQGP
jgi:hypothetical protein